MLIVVVIDICTCDFNEQYAAMHASLNLGCLAEIYFPWEEKDPFKNLKAKVHNGYLLNSMDRLLVSLCSRPLFMFMVLLSARIF